MNQVNILINHLYDMYIIVIKLLIMFINQFIQNHYNPPFEVKKFSCYENII